jgi:hypothetical protein
MHLANHNYGHSCYVRVTTLMHSFDLDDGNISPSTIFILDRIISKRDIHITIMEEVHRAYMRYNWDFSRGVAFS